MPNIYAQNTKIHDVIGRSDYITDDAQMNRSLGRSGYISGQTGRQEEVVLHIKDMVYDWDFYAAYERSHEHNPGQRQNQAREIIIALPNELAGAERGTTTEEQKTLLRNICNDLADEIIGPDHDREIAVHWNHSRTNLHVHILYSERAIVADPQVKRYKKDIWMDQKSGRLAKAGSEGAVLMHKKGDAQLNEDGTFKYSTDPLTAKDMRFKMHSFMQVRNKAIQRVLDSYGYHLDIQDKSTPYLSQRKYYKGASEDYLQKAHEYNAEVRQYNAKVREHLQIQPEREPEYKDIRRDIEETVRKENRKEKKISIGAIQAVHHMTEKVRGFIAQARANIQTAVSSWWAKSKSEILSAFRNQLNNGGNNDGRSGTSRDVAVDEFTKPQDHGTTRIHTEADRRSAAERIAALRGALTGGANEESNSGYERTPGRKSQTQRTSQRM